MIWTFCFYSEKFEQNNFFVVRCVFRSLNEEKSEFIKFDHDPSDDEISDYCANFALNLTMQNIINRMV